MGSGSANSRGSGSSDRRLPWGGGEGGTRCSFAGRGGGARGKVKLDGTTGEAAAEEGSLPLHEAH